MKLWTAGELKREIRLLPHLCNIYEYIISRRISVKYSLLYTNLELPSKVPSEQRKRKCSMTENPCAISLLGAIRFAKIFLALIRPLKVSHLCQRKLY